MTTLGTCPVDGCKEPLPHQHLCCIRHWRMVPVALRREVTAAFKPYASAIRGVSRLHARRRSGAEILALANALRAAQARAIAAVNEKETRRAIAAAAGGDVFDFG